MRTLHIVKAVLLKVKEKINKINNIADYIINVVNYKKESGCFLNKYIVTFRESGQRTPCDRCNFMHRIF